MKTSTVVAVDLGGTNARVALVAGRRILRRAEFPTEAHRGPRQVLSRLFEAIERAGASPSQRKPRQAREPVVIGLPGLLDIKRGRIHYLPNLPGWDGFPLIREATRRLQRPVTMDNDVNLMALAEHQFGAGRGARHVLCLTLGTGVGGALILDGRLHRGAHGAAGEVGHMPLHLRGDPCPCGGFGCLERSIGNRDLLERMERTINRTKQGLLHKWVYREGRPLTPELIDEAARRGDEHAIWCWRQVGQELGCTLTGVANLLDLERIVIGGGIAKAGRLLFDAVRQTIHERAMRVQRRVIVVPAELGRDAGLIGGWCLINSHKSQVTSHK